MRRLTAMLSGIGVAAACGFASCAADGREGGRGDRERMVDTQIVARGVKDRCVLQAMRTVPRERFVPESQRAFAFADGPLAIGEGQTISQPYIVALMTELARPAPGQKVLEVGTGSGYQAAVLAACFQEVFTIEILPDLGRRAEALLRDLGVSNVRVRIGDGYDGWPEAAPFHAIVVTAAPDTIPKPLLEQLKVGGRLVIPVGVADQELVVVTRTAEGFRRESVIPVRFVPMTGKAERD
ncbi:MAG TPA: protein-L-isoaspartate(D-aspartate) O-methyltransferase [Candidatus Polarisedimenticolaceae bacterium]